MRLKLTGARVGGIALPRAGPQSGRPRAQRSLSSQGRPSSESYPRQLRIH
jgi:hypothetical protein